MSDFLRIENITDYILLSTIVYIIYNINIQYYTILYLNNTIYYISQGTRVF